MGYDDKMWNYCYNTAYIILGKEKADLMLNTLKNVGGPRGFVCDTKESFAFIMEDAMKANDKVREIIKEYIEAVEDHNKRHLAKMKRKYGHKQGGKQMTNEEYEKLSDYYKSIINTWENDLYLLDRGVRSVCKEFLRYEKNNENTISLIHELQQMTITRNLYFKTFDTVSKEDGKINLAIYAYKYIHQLPLIKYVESGEKGMIREWILGKLLGYSDESMDEYLCRQLVDCFEINNTCNARSKKDEPVKEEKSNNTTE